MSIWVGSSRLGDRKCFVRGDERISRTAKTPKTHGEADEARLLGVLQVKPVGLCEAPVDGLFDPNNLVHQAVAPLLKQLQRKTILGVDHPVFKQWG